MMLSPTLILGRIQYSKTCVWEVILEALSGGSKCRREENEAREGSRLWLGLDPTRTSGDSVERVSGVSWGVRTLSAGSFCTSSSLALLGATHSLASPGPVGSGRSRQAAKGRCHHKDATVAQRSERWVLRTLAAPAALDLGHLAFLLASNRFPSSHWTCFCCGYHINPFNHKCVCS